MAANKTIGRNINKTDVAVTTTVDVGSNTAVTLLVANDDRISAICSNPNNQSLWVRERPASADNIKDGELIFPGGRYKTIPDNPYTGEISAIFASGGGTKPVVNVEK